MSMTDKEVLIYIIMNKGDCKDLTIDCKICPLGDPCTIIIDNTWEEYKSDSTHNQFTIAVTLRKTALAIQVYKEKFGPTNEELFELLL